MRLLITGAAGMLGRDVINVATLAGHDLTALPRAELDIADADAVRQAVDAARPDAVINCAAWTNVDGAESSCEAALAANGVGAGNVAAAAAAAGALIVHVSSDYVFDGSKGTPYVESDQTNPVSQYGSTKLEGELAVARAAPGAHCIVRSSWLFGVAGKNFPATILRLAGEKDELTVVDDQVGCPTFTGHLAQALVALAADGSKTGILHVAGGGQCSWYGFAREIVSRAGAQCEVKPGRTADLNQPATRPAFSVLRTERGAPQLPDWQEGLEAFMEAGVPSP
ncbi:MAG: dTDP-4-dehydrorhamnose reductase [Candidatus Limnocylindrales bacterium]